MLAFIIRRLLQAILVMLTVAFVAFLLFQYVGDPVSQMLGQDATPEDRARLRADLGLDKPFYGSSSATSSATSCRGTSASACARGGASRR